MIELNENCIILSSSFIILLIGLSIPYIVLSVHCWNSQATVICYRRAIILQHNWWEKIPYLNVLEEISYYYSTINPSSE